MDLSYLELEGQGQGIIMGVTRLLLQGPFYYIALYWVCRYMNHTVHTLKPRTSVVASKTNNEQKTVAILGKTAAITST